MKTTTTTAESPHAKPAKILIVAAVCIGAGSGLNSIYWP
jgi:hypothetical protein